MEIRIMGKKRRSSTTCSPTVVKKLSIQSNDRKENTADVAQISNRTELAPSSVFSDRDRDPHYDGGDDEECISIESTMIELLVRRGPEKTC
mmetsp:Transcript_40983/g.96222  ORF Transcript_40983/g.96222 Transcript_40983/m.96222 type:complete len:91 (-) Transcript_40983:717-989(-)